MDKEDSIEERQNSEMDVLRSMFGDDLHDLRGKAVWNQWMPLNLTINLVPQQGSSGLQEDHVKVDLHVICPKNYPNTAPQIILENAKGLSKQVLDELKGKLKLKAKELLGEVMIYEFVQITQAFLYQHNKPPTASFYDQMLKRQKEQEEAKERAKREELDRENQEIEKKIKQRKKILKSEFRLKRERLSIESSDDSPTLTMRNSFSSGGKLSGTYDHEDVVCNHGGPTIIEFSNDKVREVKKMRCTYHSKEGHVIRYQALDTTSGELFVLLEWNIKVKEDEDYHQTQKQIANIEQELIYLVKLKFSKLVHYINMTQEFCSEENSITVHILQEDVPGFVPLTTFANGVLQFNEEGIGRLAKEILTALEFLHRNNVIHRDVCASNVYLNSHGFFQVTNYSIHRRLMDLCTQCNASTKYNKKTDIYKFGILILSLIKGRTFSEDNISIPAVCSSNLKDFLARCLNRDEKERPTATQLLNHPFVEGPQDGGESFFPNIIVDNVKDVQDSYPELPITNLKTLTHNDQPRIHRDFEVIRSLGKGAYGHVLEVRNRIDGNHYAIKQIALNPRNKQLNRKMTREVTLLSKLNHENVVRYYNAWIETGILENDETDSSATPSPFVPKSVEKPKAPNKNDLELLAPHVADWSVSYESKSKVEVINEESSDDDDEEWGVVMQVAESNSDSIQFLKDGSSSSDSESSKDSSQNDERKTPKTPITREVQFMYIQMEFCEKSTLRTVIDSELYLNIARIQQLFREIVEGLAHIHQQGMIHRDLKPVNIFLDSKGHIKIGDFGLATSNITLKHGDATNINKEVQGNENQSTHSLVDGSLTGQIGTALYTAPELNSATKTIYTQKVDIYSLGIIYFEMCHKPLDTQMERIKVLSGLRSREIIFPSDFKNSELNNQETLIRWLLNHDASKRPTSQELLQSDLVPPPILEEKKLKETFVKTLGNPQSKYYKYLIASCFEQTMTPTLDIDYNLALVTCVPKSLQLFRYIKEVIENICKLHGGQTLCTPLLLPNSKYYEGVQSSVKLMAHSGIIVSIPYDLRVSFARYVAWNKITTLRRYTIDRVYRERKVFDSHPKELHECAFDIVTPNSKNFIADAEVLYIVHEIINGFPGLSNKNFRIRLNHTNLIRAILLYCGIKDAHNDIFKILSDAKEGEVTKFQVRAHLIKLGLSDSTIKLFLSFVDLEIPLEKIRTSLQMITKKTSNDAGLLAKQSLQDLKSIVEIVKALGVTFNIVIVPGMVYNIAQFSGMMCQVVCELKKKKRHSGMDVLAAGGRYDDMITYYRSMRWPSTNISKDVSQSAVGVSISFDVLGQALQDESNENYDTECVEVVVCSIGSRVQIKEIAQILKDLRSAGIRCSSIEASNAEDMQEQCTFLNVCHAIILQHNKPGAVVRTWDRNKKFQDTNISLTNVVKDFQSAIESWKEKTTDQVVTTKSDSTPKAFVVSFILNTNLSAGAKEKYEEQIKSKLENIIKHLTKPIFVVAVNLEATVIIDIGNHLNLKSERNYRDSTKTIVEMHESYKKYLLNVCHEIYYRQTLKGNPILALYSIMDSFVVFI